MKRNIMGKIYRMIVKRFFILPYISMPLAILGKNLKANSFSNELIRINLKMRTRPSPYVFPKKKNNIPTETKHVSATFQGSAKKFSGPSASILMQIYTKKSQIKKLSIISTNWDSSNSTKAAFKLESMTMIETISS